MPRLRILNATQREAYDKPSALNEVERRRAFDVPSSLADLAASVQDPAQRIGLLVSAAYFAGTRRFFSPRDYHERDVVYATRRLRLPPGLFEPSLYAARARQRHEIAILEAYGMRRLDRERETELIVEIDVMAATHLRPKLIFWRCLDLLAQRRVQLPREHRLTALIASAMARRKQQLVERVETALTPELRLALDGLFAATGDTTQDAGPGRGSGGPARLTLLKRLTQSTGAKDVRTRVVNLLEIKAIHDKLRHVLPTIGLGREGIGYFAGGVIRARMSQLHQRSDPDRHLHAIAFVAHQFARLQDNLVDTLLVSVQAHRNACQREHKERCYVERRERDDQLAGLVETVDRTVLSVLERATAIVHEGTTDDAEKLARLRSLLPADDTTSAERSSVTELRRTLTAATIEADYDDVLERRSVKLQNKVSLDLSRFGSGHLRATFAIKETGHGRQTQRRVQAGCGADCAHEWADATPGGVGSRGRPFDDRQLGEGAVGRGIPRRPGSGSAA